MEETGARLLRTAPYALLTLCPLLLGSVYAVHDAFPFRPGALAASVLAGLLAHAGVALALRAAPGELALAAGAGLLSLLTALALVPGSGASVLGVAFAGLLLAALYVAPPLPLADLGGLGEVAAAVVFGPILVSFGYAAQSGQLSAGPLLTSLPLAFLTTGVVFARHFEHAKGEADPLCPARRIGDSQAGILAKSLPLLGTLTIALGVRQGELPRLCAVAVIPAIASIVKARGLSPAEPAEASRARTRFLAAAAIATGLLLLAGFALQT